MPPFAVGCKTRPYNLKLVLAHFKQLDFINAGHYHHLFPKMLKFASKRLFTNFSYLMNLQRPSYMDFCQYNQEKHGNGNEAVYGKKSRVNT